MDTDSKPGQSLDTAGLEVGPGQILEADSEPRRDLKLLKADCNRNPSRLDNVETGNDGDGCIIDRGSTSGTSCTNRGLTSLRLTDRSHTGVPLIFQNLVGRQMTQPINGIAQSHMQWFFAPP